MDGNGIDIAVVVRVAVTDSQIVRLSQAGGLDLTHE